MAEDVGVGNGIFAAQLAVLVVVSNRVDCLFFDVCAVADEEIRRARGRFGVALLGESLVDGCADVAIEEISGEEFYGPGYEDCDRRVPDISKLKRLGWAPRYDLDETFTRCATYFYKNRKRLEALLQRAAN